MNQTAILSDNGSPSRLLLRLPIADKELSVEQSHDFTLPDYLPEIRKLLRVTVTAECPESYANASGVEYSGALLYHVLYTGADGALWSAELPAEYTLSAPIEAREKCDLSMGIDAWADVVPELVVTRVLSPRKLNLRCRMRAAARAFGFHSLEETLSGNPRGRIERLTGVTDSAVVLRGTTRGIELSDELLTDAGGSPLRIVSGEGRVFVSEVTPEKDRVSLRGELLLKLLTVREEVGTQEEPSDSARIPSVTQRRLPFAGVIDVEGVDRYFDCRGFGTLSRLSFTQEDGRIISDAEITLTAECQKNQRFAYTRDLFSTGCESESVYGEETLPFALYTANGNFTLSDTAPIADCGIAADDRILDVTGDLTADSITESGGKTLFVGKAHFHLLTKKSDSDEYAFGEVTLPFRYTADNGSAASGVTGTLPALSDSAALFEPMTVRARCDGEKLSIDAEIAVSYRTAGKNTVRLLSDARFGEPLSRERGRLVLYYPTPSDTLWDAARRYHVSPDALAQSNGIDASSDTVLKQTKYLMVEA